jgi:hypothetical protein
MRRSAVPSLRRSSQFISPISEKQSSLQHPTQINLLMAVPLKKKKKKILANFGDIAHI